MAGTSISEALGRGRRELSSVSETAAGDAQVLLADLIGRPREWLLAHPETPVPREVQDQLAAALRRLVAGEPLPYVLGWWEFYGRRFCVSPGVLIPRPETELLVEQALRALDADGCPRTVIDVGTGSGCVGITLALERKSVQVVATDLSREALLVARRNAERLGAGDRVGLVQADLVAGMNLDSTIVLANLPYVASGEARALRHEPCVALDGGAGGTEVIRRFLQQLARRRPSRTMVWLEIGAGQGQEILDLATKLCAPDRATLSHDLAGLERVVELEFGEGRQ